MVPGVEVDEGDADPRVFDLQRVLFCRSLSGVLDPPTVARLKGWQLARGLRPSGVVDTDTAKELGW